MPPSATNQRQPPLRTRTIAGIIIGVILVTVFVIAVIARQRRKKRQRSFAEETLAVPFELPPQYEVIYDEETQPPSYATEASVILNSDATEANLEATQVTLVVNLTKGR